MRRRALAILALLATAAASGMLLAGDDGARPRSPAQSEERGDPRPPTDEERIRSLLAARARALGGGRRPGRATATAARRGRDRVEAIRARRIGVRAVRFEPRDLRVTGRRATATVELGYGLKGVSARFTAERRIRFRRSAGRWRVRAVSGARRRPPWEVADFRRERSPHFVVLAPPGVDPVAGGLVAALEAGYDQMRGILVRGKLRRRYLVVVAADGAQARALTADIQGVESLAALTDTEVREAPGRARRVDELLGQRLIVVWPVFAAAGAENGATVVIHELTHAVLAPVTSGRTPAWLTEGVALYVSDDSRTAEAAGTAVGLSELSDPDAIARLSGAAQSEAYAYSSATAFYIAERYGRDRLLELYDAFNDPGIRNQRHAVRAKLGISAARLERDLRGWLGAAPL